MPATIDPGMPPGDYTFHDRGIATRRRVSILAIEAGWCVCMKRPPGTRALWLDCGPLSAAIATGNDAGHGGSVIVGQRGQGVEDRVIEIPARKGKAAHLRRGQTVRVVNTTGQQVVDTWAFVAGDLGEFMSMEHSRVAIGHIIPAVGDTFVTNRRRPILTLVEDSSGGIHDTLFAACDRWRYEQLGHRGYHDNCTDNLAAALAEIGLAASETPAPLNLFMNIPVIDGNRVEIRPPVSTPGSAVGLRAEVDCVVAFSACPQDMVPVNGTAMQPTHAHFEILD
jgi:uncharacterized protein